MTIAIIRVPILWLRLQLESLCKFTRFGSSNLTQLPEDFQKLPTVPSQALLSAESDAFTMQRDTAAESQSSVFFCFSPILVAWPGTILNDGFQGGHLQLMPRLATSS